MPHLQTCRARWLGMVLFRGECEADLQRVWVIVLLAVLALLVCGVLGAVQLLRALDEEDWD